MLVVEIQLLADRYHATAWDRGANEGDPEWPPAPWRLARAIVSAWWRMPPEERPEQERVDRLLATLVAPPRFLVPRGVAAHSRHFMPRVVPRPTDEKTTLVLDPFVRTDGSSVQMIWDDVDIPEEEQAVLDRLLDGIGYLGRGESPCIVRSVNTTRVGGIAVAPLAVGSRTERADVVRVLCLADDVSADGLSESTAARRKRQLVSAPCGRWISYLRPRSCLEPPRPASRRFRAEPVYGLRFALEGAAVPPLTEALRLAERYRAAVLSRADGAPPAVVLSLRGRVNGDERADGHVHAHYLPTDEDGDRRIDHLTVWCPGGLDREAIRALDIVTLRSWAFDHPVTLVLLDELRDDSSMGPLARARTWRSHTPFVPTRHPKRRGGRVVDGWEDQLRVELSRRSLPTPSAVRRLRSGSSHWGAFRRQRAGGRELACVRVALGFELEFDEAVRGPLALGANSHFGMGLFLPAGG